MSSEDPPDTLNTALGPVTLPYQSNSPPEHATESFTNQSSSHPHPNPNPPQSPTRQYHLPATDLQIEEIYPNEPTHRNAGQYSESHRPSPGGIVCTCGQRFQRPAALQRHLRTSKKHSAPRGPACPEPGCRSKRRFTRVDNFKAHFRKQHKKSNAEADNFIRDWRSQHTP